MLMTTWLSLLRSEESHPEFDRSRPDRPADRRDPWRNARTAYRSNPFVPPARVRAARGSRLRRAELRWMVRQRRF